MRELHLAYVLFLVAFAMKVPGWQPLLETAFLLRERKLKVSNQITARFVPLFSPSFSIGERGVANVSRHTTSGPRR